MVEPISNAARNGYGSPVFAGLREANREAWANYTEHEFVRTLGEGTLPRAAFLHYLKQDYVFLFHFSRAWALAVVKSTTLEEMTTAAATVDALVNQEMQLHVQTCAQVGVSQAELFATEETSENLAYTRFVMDAGLSGDLVDLLVALVPCVMGYGEIGLALAPSLAANRSHPYRDWISTYSGDEYQGTCAAVGALLERAVASRIGSQPMNSPRWPDLSHRFAVACRLERDFWRMGLNHEVEAGKEAKP